jgi:hypothetical protein
MLEEFFPASSTSPKSRLGVEMLDPDPFLRENMGAADRPGILVTGTTRDSPALTAGLSAGDIITRVNDTPMENSGQMATTIGSLLPGTAVRMEIIRNFRVGILSVVLGNPLPPGTPQPLTWPGLIIGVLNDATREELGLPREAQGIPVIAVSETPAWADAQKAGGNTNIKVPQRGDLVVEVEGRAVREPYEFYKAINSSLQEWIPVRFIRGQKEGFVGTFANPFLERNRIVNTWADPPLRRAARAPSQASTVPAETAAVPMDRKNLPLLSVLDFKTDELSKAQVWIVVDVLSGALVDTRRFRVLERGQRDKLLKEVESSTSEAFDEAHQLKIGRLIAADNIVIGSLAKIEGNYILSLKLVEVETGETRSAAFRSFNSLNAVMEGCPELARKLSGY